MYAISFECLNWKKKSKFTAIYIFNYRVFIIQRSWDDLSKRMSESFHCFELQQLTVIVSAFISIINNKMYQSEKRRYHPLVEFLRSLYGDWPVMRDFAFRGHKPKNIENHYAAAWFSMCKSCSHIVQWQLCQKQLTVNSFGGGRVL